MEMIIRGLLIYVFIVSASAFGQAVDTLELIVRFPNGMNFHHGDKKIFIKSHNETLLKDQIRIHDSIIELRSKSNENMVFLKLYNKRGKLYSSGLWNEEGYQSTIFFYHRNGNLKYKGHYEEGTFIRD